MTLLPTDYGIRQLLHSVAAAIHIRRNSVTGIQYPGLPFRVLMFILKLVIKISNNVT